MIHIAHQSWNIDQIMTYIEARVDSIRQALLKHNKDFPWVIIIKSKSSNEYLPIYISESQADLIQKLLLDDDAIPIESLLKNLSLPVERMLKSILQSVIIESPEEKKYQAKLILKSDDKDNEVVQVALSVGNAIALSFITKVPIFIDKALLIQFDSSASD